MRKVTVINRYVEYVILVVFAIFITEAFLQASAFDFLWPERLHNILRGALLALIILKYIAGWVEYGLKDVPKVIILCIIALALASSRFFNDVGSFIDVGLLLLALKDVDLRKILKIFLFVILIMLALAMIAALSMNVENYLSYHSARPRYAFGTLSAIDFAAYFFYLEMVWFALRREKIRYFEFGIIVIVIAALIWLCNARTSALVMALALIIAFIFKLRSRSLEKRKITRPLIPVWMMYAGATLIIVFAAFIIIATWRYSENDGISVLLDKALNRRLQLGKHGIDEYGFSLFGRMVETTGVPGTADYFFIDSSYVFILLRYGIVTLLGALAVFLISAFHAAKKRDAWIVMILAFVALQSLMEHHLLQVNYDPFIYVLSAAGGALSRNSRAEAETAVNPVRSVKGKLPLSALVSGAVLLVLFVGSTVYFLFTAGSDPQYAIYETTVPGVTLPGALVAEEDTAQEVLLPKDVNGVDILFETDGSELDSDYIWKMWCEETGYEAVETIPKEDIREGTYTRILTDSRYLQSWMKYRFIIYPENEGEGELEIALGEPTNDFTRPVYIDEKQMHGSVMNFNLVYRYNDWRMMVWIFEVTTLAVICYLYFSSRRKVL